MIPRFGIDRLSPDAAYGDVFGLMRASRPFVLTGGAATWLAADRWTPAFLSERYGSEPVEFARCGTRERVQRRLEDYFLLPEQERSTWYLVDWDFRQSCPDLLRDFSVPDQFSLDWLADVPRRHRPDLMWIYIGYAGTYGPTHIDNFGSSAWLAVVQGTKRVVFPTLHADVSSAANIDLFQSSEDPKVIQCAEAVLRAGDVLFVPAGSWHAARNETYCLSVTANFIDGNNFSQHRKFAMRGWFGPRMLANQLDRLSAMTDRFEQEQLRLHIAEALQSYRASLDEEVALLETLHSRLGA